MHQIPTRATDEHNANIPIRPNPNIFQRTSSDIKKINHEDAAGIYQINYGDHKRKQ